MEQIAERAKTRSEESAERFSLRPRRLLLFADLVCGAIGAYFAYAVLHFRSDATRETLVTAILAMLIIILTISLLTWSGQYTKRQRISRLSDVGILTRDMAIGSAGGVLIAYLTKGFFTGVTGPSRLAIGSFVLVFWALCVGARFILSSYQRRLFAKGRGVRRIAVLGAGPEADRMIEFVKSRPWLGVVVTGRLDLDEGEGSRSTGDAGDGPAEGEGAPGAPGAPGGDGGGDGLPAAHLTSSLEGLRRLDDFMRATGAAEVIIAIEPDEHDKLPEITGLLSLVHIPCTVVPSLFEETLRTGGLFSPTLAPVLEMNVDPPDRLIRVVKRTMDVCVSAVALLVLIPTGLPLALAIVADSGRPVFYSQERVGRYGRLFNIHKFRTMVVDAEARLEELKSRDEGDGPHFKMARDPRLTRVGAFLRKWSIDELPQFYTVLKGDMSLVGPRPPLPREVANYDSSQLVRLRGKPGITGLWQVSGRKNLTFDMVALDRFYLENWSLRLDFSIILRTFSAVLTRRGAY